VIWDELTQLGDRILQSHFQLAFPDRVHHEQVLLLEQLVHALFGEFRFRGDLTIRGRALPYATAGYENHRLKQMGSLPGLALHVINDVAVLYIGIKTEDHDEEFSLCAAMCKIPVNAAFPSLCALDTLMRRSL